MFINDLSYIKYVLVNFTIKHLKAKKNLRETNIDNIVNEMTTDTKKLVIMLERVIFEKIYYLTQLGVST